MKVFASALLLLAGTAGVWAQRMGARPIQVTPPLQVQGTVPFRTFGSIGGFGNVLFPGTGNQPPLTDPFSFPSTFATRLGATISGFPGFSGAPRGGFGRGRGAGTVVVPYPYPVYMGGYGEGYGQPQPNVTIVMPPQYPAQAVPPVTINQTFVPETAKPAIREYAPGAQEPSGLRTYSAPTPGGASEDQVLFFIALKDSTIYTALAYWVEDGTLHYITSQGKHNQVSLDLVDRDLSAKLNQGRQVEFRLPPATK